MNCAPWIETHTGKQFWFLNPSPEMFDIEDIAHALSMVCRYAGHVTRFYSVAAHCCVIADHFSHDPRLHLTALMHDAAEAYIGDMPRPLKRQLPQFRKVEVRIEQALAETFGLIYPWPKVIKDADLRITLDERRALKPYSTRMWAENSLMPLGVTIPDWSPERAKWSFLNRYDIARRRCAA